MSRAVNLDTASETRKRKESPRDSKPLSESDPKPDESNLRAGKEAWVTTPAPDFLIRPQPSQEKDKLDAETQVEVEPVTVRLTPEPARAAKTRRRRSSTSLGSYVLYAALFVATAATSAAVVLFVL
ncbi:MAG: hypothetical protein ACFCUR_06575 [Rhodomicrobiaceae bacterium]